MIPELLAPAGDPEKLRAALDFGADAVYLAGTAYGMRSNAGNFAPEELEEKLLLLPGVLEAVISGEGESRDIKAEVYPSMPEEFVRKAIGELNLTLPVYKRIKTIVIRKEPFPRTSSGKIKV